MLLAVQCCDHGSNCTHAFTSDRVLAVQRCYHGFGCAMHSTNDY